jgi:competence/damage-inducible protein CinA-like protein
MSEPGELRARKARPAPAAGAPPRAGIVVTGTEVLGGRVRDRNGPWLAERLRELGLALAHTTIVGDRRSDIEAALDFMAAQRLDVVLTSGGLGPTADDLTAEVVGRFQGREMALDAELEQRIARILAAALGARAGVDRESVRAGNRKQATIPAGAAVLEPVGTAPGLVVPPARGREGPTILVLPGPPRELRPMWHQALQTDELRAVLARAAPPVQRMLRLFGVTESEIAHTLRDAESIGVELAALEITTCLKDGEVEIVTSYDADAQRHYDALARLIAERHAGTLFSTDGSSVDDQVARLLLGSPDAAAGACTVAVAESCTGGLLAARLTARPGSSAYFRGGVVAYANEAKIAQAGVASELIEAHGAVSAEVAQALARGVSERLGADVGVGVTGIAGPTGASEGKPVGLVWLSVLGPGERGLTRSVTLPGARADVRERATSVAMHLIRRVLLELRAVAPAASGG